MGRRRARSAELPISSEERIADDFLRMVQWAEWRDDAKLIGREVANCSSSGSTTSTTTAAGARSEDDASRSRRASEWAAQLEAVTKLQTEAERAARRSLIMFAQECSTTNVNVPNEEVARLRAESYAMVWKKLERRKVAAMEPERDAAAARTRSSLLNRSARASQRVRRVTRRSQSSRGAPRLSVRSARSRIPGALLGARRPAGAALPVTGPSGARSADLREEPNQGYQRAIRFRV